MVGTVTNQKGHVLSKWVHRGLSYEVTMWQYSPRVVLPGKSGICLFM